MPDTDDTGAQSAVVVSIGAPDRIGALLPADRFGRILWIDPLATPARRGLIAQAAHEAWMVAGEDVGPAPDKAELCRYSVPDLFGTGAPMAGLRQIFPGLQVTDRIEVPLRAAAAFLAALDDLPGALTLVVDAPGCETAILGALEGSAVLDRLARLVIRCGIEAFFAGAAGAGAVEAWARRNGAEVHNRDMSDPDWPVVTIRPTQAGRELRVALAEVGRLQAAHQAIEHERAGAQARSATLEAGMAEAARIQAGLQARLQLASDKEAALAKERDAARAQGEAAQSELAAAQAQLVAARSDMAIAMRLQAAASADLEHLRGMYEDVCQTRDRQAELLQQLVSRLREAASQLRAMAADDAQAARLPDETPAGVPGVALPGRDAGGDPSAPKSTKKKRRRNA